MSQPHNPHPSRCPNFDSWTIAVLLAASSLACDDEPVTPLATPSQMQKIAGDGQAGRVSQEIAEPLVVSVLDESGVPVEGVSVAWAAQGGGSVDPDTVPTGSDGIAATRRVLGPTAGDQITTAAVSEALGIPPVTFMTTAVVEE